MRRISRVLDSLLAEWPADPHFSPEIRRQHTAYDTGTHRLGFDRGTRRRASR